MTDTTPSHGCAPKPAIQDRDLIPPATAAPLAEFFKVFTSQTRLQILHSLLRGQERSVTQLAEEVGMSAQAVSNQLQKMSSAGIVSSRREGNRVFYAVANPCIPILFERGWCLLEELPHQGQHNSRSSDRVGALV